VIREAGTFKQPAEAEKLQAKLAQYGVGAKIQRFALEDETWYRVRIGPIATVGELVAIQAWLSEGESKDPFRPGDTGGDRTGARAAVVVGLIRMQVICRVAKATTANECCCPVSGD
jgi:hypothetical protein